MDKDGTDGLEMGLEDETDSLKDGRMTPHASEDRRP